MANGTYTRFPDELKTEMSLFIYLFIYSIWWHPSKAPWMPLWQLTVLQSAPKRSVTSQTLRSGKSPWEDALVHWFEVTATSLTNTPVIVQVTSHFQIQRQKTGEVCRFVCVCLHVCIYAEVSMRTHKKVSSSLFFSFLWVDMSTRLQLLYRNMARFFHWLLQPMFMKQDIWDIYFETGVRMDLMCQNLLTITLRV